MATLEKQNHMNKPRLAEDAESLWREILKLSVEGTVTNGVVYPVCYLPLIGYISVQKVPQKFVEFFHIDMRDGITLSRISDAQEQLFHEMLDDDQIDVYTMTRPGYQSNWGPPKITQVLHSASGNRFKQK